MCSHTHILTPTLSLVLVHITHSHNNTLVFHRWSNTDHRQCQSQRQPLLSFFSCRILLTSLITLIYFHASHTVTRTLFSMLAQSTLRYITISMSAGPYRWSRITIHSDWLASGRHLYQNARTGQVAVIFEDACFVASRLALLEGENRRGEKQRRGAEWVKGRAECTSSMRQNGLCCRQLKS